ncbi:hypothetical protein SERLA73DRAFT_45709 [Serpula lacrymans var. lacrymans S7.3]|uniref:Uncharacterized protein n=1 Tax=Serpula lacrymans var. lacrymans (strain S7.3) TaxID=936435 RepID=F8PK86_SERL3|nr:hypothetical protein SERLA73DRAFT_45709 [Serpula lacrymans var. lacrymans S7.3]
MNPTFRSHQQLLITVNTDLLTAVRVYKLNNIPTYQKVFHKKRYHHFSQAQVCDNLKIVVHSLTFPSTPGSLDSYSRKSDCFQQAASRLRSRCGESHMSENERIQGAISMTLCELATARHHSPPLECSAFADSRIPFVSTSHVQGDCVEALSRSAQFWSSYSGYLREIRKCM